MLSPPTPIAQALTLHQPPAEFDSEAFLESAEFKAAAEGKKEVRRWKLYKAFDNTAPKAQ